MMGKPNKAKRPGRGRHRAASRTAAKISVPRHHSNLPYAIPELKLIYDTAPIGLAFLTPDGRYVQINQRLTEICGISVADHIGRSVRETVPQVADQVEKVLETVMSTGEPVAGVEVHGQRADKLNADRVWITNWHPLRSPDGSIVGINVVAEEITERKRTETVLTAKEMALRQTEVRFRELADNISQFAWTADQSGWYTGIISVGTTTPVLRLKRCRGGVGRRCTIPSMSNGSSNAFDRASKAALLGRIPSLCAAVTAAIGGFSRAPFPYATKRATSSAGLAPTPISQS